MTFWLGYFLCILCNNVTVELANFPQGFWGKISVMLTDEQICEFTTILHCNLSYEFQYHEHILN